MELSKDTRLMEPVALKSYQGLLNEQRGLFQNQIEKLQHIVATQCKLTGVNPLSQEMAASALSIKIGKRPRDLLNPKAVKYMQLVFSMKDAISKRETREISAQFGVTVTQVRDFFTGQRTRVRKFVRLSREKSNTPACELMLDGITSTSNLNIPAEPIPLEAVAPISIAVAPTSIAVAPTSIAVAPISIDDGPSCSKRHEDLSGLADSDMHFVENIFGLMRKEESFSGQIKLMSWIMRITNPSVLNWFLIEGGLMILATWLGEAAKEEQTSYLLVILKLLDYLPVSKALPGHMSAILQSVNRLRFYRSSDISHRARTLLSKWSKMLGKNLSSKKNNALKSASDLQDEMLLKQSITEVMCNESWDLKKENHEDALRFISDNPDSPRKLDTAQPLKMIMASGDDSNKRRGVFPPQTRERRKVQLVEHPGQRLAARSPQVARSTSATQSRPLSADDIQKAKMRAQFMQNKHGKTIAPPDEKIKPDSEKQKSDIQNKMVTVNDSHPSLAAFVSKSIVQTEFEEHKKLDDSLLTPSTLHETSLNLEEPHLKKHKRIQIPWQIPPEVKIDETWSVGNGTNSKEVEFQNNRIRREREVVYRTIHEIPSDPREPWDREMDCDDSLTPVIPIEQLPDVESLANPPNNNIDVVAPGASTSSESIPEPDFELLAELLKNPELVFALTSGQAGNLSSDETLKLLDRIKSNGVSSLGNLAGNANNKVEVSLPSPTPSSDPVPNGVKPDFSRNPFSRQQTLPNGNMYQVAGAAVPIRQQGMVQSQLPATMISTPQPSATAQQYGHRVAQSLPEQWQQAHTNPQLHHQSRPNASNSQHYTSDMVLNANASPVSNSLRARQDYESNHSYQSNQSVNYHHAYAGGSVQAPWGSRTNVADRPEYESWSLDNSPSRPHEYLPGRYNSESSNGYRHGKATQHNMGQPSGYQDGGNKRWQDRRR